MSGKQTYWLDREGVDALRWAIIHASTTADLDRFYNLRLVEGWLADNGRDGVTLAERLKDPDHSDECCGKPAEAVLRDIYKRMLDLT